ncbi:hypothetical protein GCM10017566_58630 [Amycolatopsis bartoniae]|uniref:Uncharacterized protein n=1 Tax=Amycolatopsis bartoniae TaxID=941986 RepID=A0A8H9IY93_9PSEU|nr:hypothetical protein GCM10017566_58630 [Amycolatopsis bartoniae]
MPGGRDDAGLPPVADVVDAHGGLTESRKRAERGRDGRPLEEVEVRFAVQALLRTHVHSGPAPGESTAPEYWGDDLDVPRRRHLPEDWSSTPSTPGSAAPALAEVIETPVR